MVELDFLVIGTEKGGSTYLLESLRQHPGIFMPRQEPSFFDDCFYDPNDTSGLNNHFDAADSNKCLGIKRPSMLANPHFPERLQTLYPNAKLIAVLRHPVERALAAFVHHRSINTIPNTTAEIFFSELLSSKYSTYPRAKLILDYGLYAKHLNNILDYFPREQVFLTTLDDLKVKPNEIITAVYSFLGVDPSFLPHLPRRRPMPAPYSSAKTLYRRFATRILYRKNYHDHLEERHGFWMIPLKAIHRCIIRLSDLLLPHGNPPKISTDLKNRLVDFYMKDVCELEHLLKQDLGQWKTY